MADNELPPEPPDDDAEVLVFRHPETQRPTAVPREVVLEGERPYRAFMRNMGGESWITIAAAEGYPDARAAAQDVERYLAAGRALVADLSIRSAQRMAMARYNELLRGVWSEAIKGKLGAATLAMQLIDRQVKLVGADQLPEAGGEDTGPRTLVIGADGNYEADLQRLAEDEPR